MLLWNPRGRLFCLIRTVCTRYPFICLLSSRDARYKPYCTVITAARLFMCFHLVLFRYLLARFCRQGGKSTLTVQILPNLVQLLWQVTNQAVLCLIQHFVCWKTESCGWKSETNNWWENKWRQRKLQQSKHRETFCGRKWAQAASCILGKLDCCLYPLSFWS